MNHYSFCWCKMQNPWLSRIIGFQHSNKNFLIKSLIKKIWNRALAINQFSLKLGKGSISVGLWGKSSHQQVDSIPSAWAKETPISSGARCPHLPSFCRPAGGNTRRSPLAPWPTFAKFWKKSPRDGRPCLKKKKKKSKFDDLAKSNKAHYDREIKNCVLPEGGKKKDPSAPERPLSSFFLFALNIADQEPKWIPRPVYWRCCTNNRVSCLNSLPKTNNCMSRKQLN